MLHAQVYGHVSAVAALPSSRSAGAATGSEVVMHATNVCASSLHAPWASCDLAFEAAREAGLAQTADLSALPPAACSPLLASAPAAPLASLVGALLDAHGGYIPPQVRRLRLMCTMACVPECVWWAKGGGEC